MPTLYTSLLARHEGFDRNPDLDSQAPISISALGQGIRQIRQRGIAAKKMAGTEAKRERRGEARGTRKVDVVVVGAGLAGLCAAYELARAGYSVEVVEARHEVGGRTRTAKRIAGKRAMDKGAELIGSNHALWLHYRSQFKLHLTGVKEYGNSPIRFHGRTLSWDETDKLNKGLKKILKKLNSAAERILDPYEPWMNPDATKLDNQSLEGWARKATKDRQSRYALLEMMETDGGVSAKKQSLLGVLAMIKGGGLNRFWKDTEVYRCKGGTQSLALAFEKQLDKLGVPIHKCVQVCGIEIDETHARIKTAGLERSGKDRETKPTASKAGRNGPSFVSDFVILAIPPSVWRTIKKLDPRPLRSLLHGSQRPQMGQNTKFLMGFKTRFWNDAALGPTLTEDGPVDLTWETTEASQKGDIGMVAFSGAGDAKTLSRLARNGARSVRNKVLTELQPVYQGVATKLQKSEFVNWPENPWTKASYCFPKPGDVTYWGPIYKAGFQNRLFFAGEHTSWAFMGYMEGALSSGYRVAARIALRDTLGIG